MFSGTEILQKQCTRFELRTYLLPSLLFTTVLLPHVMSMKILNIYCNKTNTFIFFLRQIFHVRFLGSTAYIYLSTEQKAKLRDVSSESLVELNQ
jgi:hypothetical protein